MRVSELIKHYRKVIKSSTLETASKSTYYARLNIIENYLVVAGLNKLTLDELDLLSSERHKAVNKARDLFTGFDAYIEKRKLSKENYMIMLSMLINFANSEYGYMVWNKHKYKKEKKLVVVFDNDTISKIVDKNVYDKLQTHKLKGIHEVALVQLFTTLRVGDALEISKENIVMYDGSFVITSKNKKTGEVTTAPIPKFLAEILLYNIRVKGRTYSFRSRRGKYNYIVHNIAHYIAALTKIVPEIKKYGKITSHMFRRSGISYLLNSGIPESNVKSLSGHSHSSGSFARYVNINNELVLSSIKEAQNKLYEKH